MKTKLLKSFLAVLFFSNIIFGQSTEVYSINNEIFELPEKWKFLGKIENSGQYIFDSKKLKLGLLISVRKMEWFEFYSKDLTEFEFLNKFYAWETEFWGKDDNNVEIEKIETNETDKIIIWRLKIIDKNMDNFILSGVRNGKLIELSLSDSNKKEPRSRTEMIEFLKKKYFRE